MKNPIFRGSAAALITPFCNDGTLDLTALKTLIRWQLEADTDALVVCATTGECATLSDLEWETVLSVVCEQVNNKIPVIAGVGKNNTAHTAALCHKAKLHGAQGVLAVTPYYNKTTQTGLIRHYTAVADAEDIPVLLYNVPSRTGMSITAETYGILAEHPNIFGTKEASGDFGLILKIRKLCPEDFTLYSGNDDQIIPILALGGAGVISTMANVVPKETHDICALWDRGDRTQAASIQIRLQPLIEALFKEVNPIPVKAAMEYLNKCSSTVRLPLVGIGNAANRQLYSAMKDLFLI